MDTSDTQHLTLTAKAHDGKVTIRAEIPVSGEAEDYLVTIVVSPQLPEHPATQPAPTLDQLYGALADSPLPEITDDPMPESRDEL